MTAGNVPYIFTANTTIVSAQVNANFAALVTDLNAIDGGQITAGSIAIARLPIITLAKGGSGSDLSATGPGVLVQASNAAVVTVSSQLALARGGSAADLSATGPGVLQQAALGAAVTIAANGQLPATATNDDAAAGKLGELMTANNISGPASLSNNIAKTITSLSLTGGDWDVYGDVSLNSSAGMTTTKGAISFSADTFDLTGAYEIQNLAGVASFAHFGVPFTRVQLTGAFTVRMTVLAAFPSGTVTAAGAIYARRAR